MSEIEEIKRLAKETLEKKWYPLSKETGYISANDPCCFCQDKKERHPENKNFCKGCLILKYDMHICNIIDGGMSTEDVEYIVSQLEQLAEKGKLK